MQSLFRGLGQKVTLTVIKRVKIISIGVESKLSVCKIKKKVYEKLVRHTGLTSAYV